MISIPHSLSFTPKPLKSGVFPFYLLKMLSLESQMIQSLAWLVRVVGQDLAADVKFKRTPKNSVAKIDRF